MAVRGWVWRVLLGVDKAFMVEKSWISHGVCFVCEAFFLQIGLQTNVDWIRGSV